MGLLVAIVASLGCLPAGLAFVFRRNWPAPVILFLSYLAAVGYITALAATDTLAHRSTFLLGKVIHNKLTCCHRTMSTVFSFLVHLLVTVADEPCHQPLAVGMDVIVLFFSNKGGFGSQTPKGTISWWGYLLFWPYHVGLRLKLRVQSLLSTEDPYNEILPGW